MPIVRHEAGNRSGSRADDVGRAECGFVAYNDQDGETYRCCLAAHGPKIKHGNWAKI